MAHILIIEDNEQDQKIMQRLLAQAGFNSLSFAKTGEEGIARVAAENPEIVVIDTLLPGIDGFETCRRMREDLKTPRKLIMITGYLDAIDATQARRMGADDFVVKTQDHQPLITALQNLSTLTS